MKNILIPILTFLSFTVFGQNIKLTVNNQSDSTVFLVKYYGKNLLYADTAEMVNGTVKFDGNKQKGGMLGLLLPGQKFFEFIYDGKDIEIETTGPDYVANMKVKKSDANKRFLDYIKFLNGKRIAADAIVAKSKDLDKESKEYKKYTDELDKITDEVKAYQQNYASKFSSELDGKMVRMSAEIVIPEAPKDEKGNVIDSTFKYKYLRDHYFDNIDFSDDRLMNSNMFDQKVQYFIGDKFLLQDPDTIAKYVIRLLNKMDYRSEMFKYTLTQAMVKSEQSNVMGMDKLFVILGEKYYCSDAPDGAPYVTWMDEDKLKDLCKKVATTKNLTIGAKAINISLPDSTQKVWHDFYTIKNDYLVLFFWEATCGHCKLAAPLLEKLYEEKLKARDVEVMGISKAIGEDFGLWKTFIKEKNLTFVNVALTDSIYKIAMENPLKLIPRYTTLESLNFQDTYDIYSTPRVFVLDKDRKILAKRLSISQLEDFMDRIQGHQDAEKIIPADSKQ